MSFFIRMPKLSPTMELGIIAKWHLKEGDRLAANQTVLEVATDKATIEHQCLDTGFLRKILIQEGEEAAVNQPIALVTPTLEEDMTALLAEIEKAQAPQPVAISESAETVNQIVEPVGNRVVQSGYVMPQFKAAGPVSLSYNSSSLASDAAQKISPYARKLANEKQLDLSLVKGTGPSGRIIAQDLEAAPIMNEWQVSLNHTQKPSLAAGSFELEMLSPMRKAIATRLQEAKMSIPHFYVAIEVNAKPLSQLQQQLKAQGLKVSINDLLIRACSLTLKKHPHINSGYDSSEHKIIRFKTIDIAVAVALDEGLITPILFHTDYKSVFEISQSVKKLVKAAQNQQLEPHEYRGGSFTISNLGMFGVDSFQAIINPPQAAILAVGGMIEKPVVTNGSLQVGLTMQLTLSCDHRVVDGADGAKFLSSLKQLVESPAILLV